MVEVRHIYVYERENKRKKSETQQRKSSIMLSDRCRDTCHFNTVELSDEVHCLWECV